MLQYSIIFVLVTCLLKRGLGDVTPSHATLFITGGNVKLHESQNVNSKLLASLRTFVLPLNNNVEVLHRVRREKNKQEDCGRSKVCKDARQYRVRYANNRYKSSTRMPFKEQNDPMNLRKRTTQKPSLVSFQYKKTRQGNRAVATYSQRGFAVACPDCAPGWQVLLSLEPAPPGRVPLSCLNCPVGWESLINIAPPVSKPLTNNKNNMKTNAPTLKNQNFVPTNGQTIISNGKSFVPLGPIIGPGGLLYVPVSPATGTGTWNPNDWKVPPNSWDHATDENGETDHDNVTEKGSKKTVNNKGKGTTKSLVVSASGKKTTKTTSKPSKKQTTDTEVEENEEENKEEEEENTEEDDEKDDEEESQENEDEKTTGKSKTTAKSKTTIKSASKTTKKSVKSESDVEAETKPHPSEATTEKLTAAAATTVATTAKPVAVTTTPPTATKAAAIVTPAAKPVEVTTAAATTKVAAVAAPALPGGLTIPSGLNLPAGVDPSSLMSAVGGGGGGLGGMLGGFLGPKPTTVATTRVDPGKAGADLGFDMGEDL